VKFLKGLNKLIFILLANISKQLQGPDPARGP